MIFFVGVCVCSFFTNLLSGLLLCILRIISLSHFSYHLPIVIVHISVFMTKCYMSQAVLSTHSQTALYFLLTVSGHGSEYANMLLVCCYKPHLSFLWIPLLDQILFLICLTLAFYPVFPFLSAVLKAYNDFFRTRFGHFCYFIFFRLAFSPATVVMGHVIVS